VTRPRGRGQLAPRSLGVAFVVTVASTTSPYARADASATGPNEETPAPRRYEFFPIPSVGGNTDVGVEVGVAFTLARFYDDDYPYRWLFNGVFAASFKDDANGFRAVQQYYLVRVDLPNLFGGLVRIDSRVNFTRAIDAPYYGVGNASVVGGLPPVPNPALEDQYRSEELRLRSLVRVKTGTPFDAAFGTNLRYEMPQTYAGSRLAQDAGRGAIVGTDRALLAGLAGGIILDTRDDEFVPTRGVYYQIGGAGTAGTAQHVAYGEAAAVLSSYFPVARFVTFAVRVMTSFELGRVPFYDLQQGGVFNQQYMIGADRGVRGVRLGRYAGRAKVLANYELRTTLIPRFRVLSWKVQVGTTTFFDASGAVMRGRRSTAPRWGFTAASAAASSFSGKSRACCASRSRTRRRTRTLPACR
jgi:hypothetical protein